MYDCSVKKICEKRIIFRYCRARMLDALLARQVSFIKSFIVTIFMIQLQWNFGKVFFKRRRKNGSLKVLLKFKFVAYFFPPMSETRLPVLWSHSLLYIYIYIYIYIYNAFIMCFIDFGCVTYMYSEDTVKISNHFTSYWVKIGELRFKKYRIWAWWKMQFWLIIT